MDESRHEGTQPERSLQDMIDEQCDRFEGAWASGRPPRIEDYLIAGSPDQDSPPLRELLFELVMIDLERRWRPGFEEVDAPEPPTGTTAADTTAEKAKLPVPQCPRLADYLARYSEMGPASELSMVIVLHEYRVRKRCGDRPSHEEYLETYGPWHPELKEMLCKVDQEFALDQTVGHIKPDADTDHPARPRTPKVPCPRCSRSVGIDGDKLPDETKCAWCGNVFRPGDNKILQGQPEDDDHRRQRRSVDISTSAENVNVSRGQRFRILRSHAEGGLGRVSVALDEDLHREVAFKELKERHANDPHFRSRFVVEAEITGSLEHPGIVPVYGLGEHADGRPFCAMRLIHGKSLKEAIEQFHGNDGHGNAVGQRTLEFRRLLGCFIDVCNAIQYAHSRGVVHRDLKPSNIMLGKFGETLVVDWGLAKPVGRTEEYENVEERTLHPASGSHSAPTQMGSVVGTPAYMSPQQSEGSPDRVGQASDIYSLGATFNHMFTGGRPIQGSSVSEVLSGVKRGEFPKPRQVNSAIPRALEAICLKAMALKPEDRYATPNALALPVFTGLTSLYPDVPRYKEELAACRDNLGSVVSDLGRNREAESLHESAVSACQALAETYPDFPQYRQRRSVTRSHYGQVLHKLGEHEAAREAYWQAIDTLKQLLVKEPDNTAYQDELAFVCRHLGELYWDTGEKGEAKKALLQAQNLWQGLVAKTPLPEYLDNLAWHSVSCIHTELRDEKLAIKHAREAREKVPENDLRRGLSCDRRF